MWHAELCRFESLMVELTDVGDVTAHTHASSYATEIGVCRPLKKKRHAKKLITVLNEATLSTTAVLWSVEETKAFCHKQLCL